jgi:hypothetical protein
MLTRQPSYPASKSLGKHSSRDSKAGKKGNELQKEISQYKKEVAAAPQLDPSGQPSKS